MTGMYQMVLKLMLYTIVRAVPFDMLGRVTYKAEKRQGVV